MRVDSQLTDSLASQIFDIWKDTKYNSTVQVSGWSMYPFIEDGDSVVLIHTHQVLKPGDTVAFRKDQRILVHRVLRCYQLRGETIYVTRGDNNRHIDPRVHEQAIVGRVAAIVRKNNKRINLETPLWRLIGRMIAKSVSISRVLPRQLVEQRFIRTLGRVVLRILSSF
jgi:signal peptidase I